MAQPFNESTVEKAAMELFADLGYQVGFAPVDAAVGTVRDTPDQVIL